MSSWHTQNTYFFLFNVGRGFCSLIRLPIGTGILYDIGKSSEFNPLEFIEENILPKLTHQNFKLDQIIFSHPHVDHIASIDYLKKRWENTFYPRLLTCPHDKEPLEGYEDERINWDRVNNPTTDFATNVIEIYKSLYEERDLPLQTIRYEGSRYIPNLEYGIFYVRPPICEELFPKDDQKYTNSTSLVLWYRHGNNTLLLPGDITPEALETILNEEEGIEKRFSLLQKSKMDEHPDWHKRTSDQPSLKSLLEEHGLSILVAPHHGLESGFSEDLYETIKGGKPDLVLISEKRHTGQNDGQVASKYQSSEGANGLIVNIEKVNDSGETYIEEEERYSLSTRNNHHILVVFKSSGKPEVYARKDPEGLIEIIESNYES